MANAQTAIQFARIYLNDINGITWTDSILMQLLQVAHLELQQELNLNNSSVIKAQTLPLTVAAGATTLGTQQPSNIINPISMIEGDPGTDPNSFEDMIRVDFIPYIDKTNWLTYWAWIGQVITFLGSLAQRQVVLRYEGFLTTPQLQTDPLGCLFAESYIGPRIVSLAYTSSGKDNKTIQATADRNLYKLIQAQVLDNQKPTRRKAYRSFKGITAPVGTSVPISMGTSSGGEVRIPSTTVPNGVITAFAFPYIPKFVIWNGLEQFQGVGYNSTCLSN